MQTLTNQTTTPNRKERYVVAIELGSSRAKIGIAGYDPTDEEHKLTVYNMSSLPTIDTMRYGRLTNIREASVTVKKLLEAVENKYPIQGYDIMGCYISVGGMSLKSQKVNARIVLPERCEITEDLVERLQDEAIDKLTVADELVCIHPIQFRVDNVQVPRAIGTLGSRISGEYSAVVYNETYKNDLVEMLEKRVKIDVAGITVRPIAIAHLVLSRSQINAGCMLVDFGAETITVAIFKDYALQYLATIPIGSRLITKDIAKMLSLTEDEAEKLKISKANALPDEDGGLEADENQEALDEIVRARLADIIANIAVQPEYAGLQPAQIASGIILTGGGSKMRNFPRLLEMETGMKVRIATLPNDVIIADTDLSTTDNLDLIALLNEGAEESRNYNDDLCLLPIKNYDEEEPVRQETHSNGYDSEKTVLIDDKDTTEEIDLSPRPPQRGYGEEAEEPHHSWDGRSYDDGPNHFGNEDLNEDDGPLLADDETAQRIQEEKERKNKTFAAKQEAKRRKQQEKAERERLKQEERIQRQIEKEKREHERDTKPTKSDRIRKWLVGMLAGDDNSAELDE